MIEEPVKPMAVVGKKHPALYAVSAPVLLDELEHPRRLELLTQRMLATCRIKGGIAIAAPQVGVNQRIVVTWDGKVIMNPEFDCADDEVEEEQNEGCLSLPGRVFAVSRPIKGAISWIDLSGADGYAMVEGLDARMFQHEIDHLDGILISMRGREVPNVNQGEMKF